VNTATHFVDPLSVEAWDDWFRWRTPQGLQDLTIDDTWTRVAQAVAAVEGAAAPEWSARFINALRQWQMLPDEGVLALAGTGQGRISGQRATVINAAAFVSTERSGTARVHYNRLRDVAALAVRYLCDAIQLDAGDAHEEPAPHVGLLGIADAIAALGLRYDSEAARAQAGEIAAAVHAGCRQGLERYIAEHATPPATAITVMLHPNAKVPRHDTLAAAASARTSSWITALTPHPRLALLANHRGDMVDAAARSTVLGGTGTTAGRLNAGAAGKALHHPESRAGIVDPGRDDPAARVLMRAAVHSWIDMPINAPFLVDQLPDPAARAHCAELARRHGLPTPRWHIDSARLPPTSALR
jgi:ribonucleoside-diphosphate reductase alpha chain